MGASKFILLLSAIFILAQDSAQFCQPSDEFENDEATPEWNNFMNTLSSLTLMQSETSCEQDPAQKVFLNSSSQFVWDLRFKVYSDSEETREQCYKAQEKGDCDKGVFRKCMKEARSGMYEDISSSWWAEEIQKELTRMSKEC